MVTFESLKDALKTATKEYYQRYLRMHPNESYYGFSLYTDSDVSSFGPAATRATTLRGENEDGSTAYYRYGPHEWSDWEDFGLFAESNSILKELYSNKFIRFERYKNKSLEAAYTVLQELTQEGIFGSRDEHSYVVVWISDSGHPIMDKAVKEFNSPKIWEAYVAAYVDI